MLVVDASVALAWCLPDERSDIADGVLDLVVLEGAMVPAIWPVEVANAIWSAERRGRLTSADAARLRAFLSVLPIEVIGDGTAGALGAGIAMARAHGLSLYDASYLVLAAERGLPVATLDDRLGAACRTAGIELVV